MESGPHSKTAPVPKAQDLVLDPEIEKIFIAYLDKHVPAATGAIFDFSSILNEAGILKFEVFLKWWRIALGWNENAFSAQKKEYLKGRREVFKSEDPADHEKWLKMSIDQN